ncbi:MAG: 2-amino-5-chloromuconate deaminase [Planctomycetaceae bacterium]|nr:2-amino-5-chloromuconate deaminase [Planctomycetaceae bacterium]MBP62759.1 2-amino-5-chloromuconate deaminase [Planctomycetaceae bacterium]
MKSDPETLSLEEIAIAFREGKLKAAELTEACIDSRNELLGAYKSWQPDVARGMAIQADNAFADARDLGPLQGVPVSIKDIYAVSGMEIFAGSPRHLPDKLCVEGPFVRCLRDQHAVFTGKTHTVEFACGGLGVNSHWGTPRNPWDGKTHRVPGGSSSGAGVSLLEGSALVALGSDTGGSVRVPASMTGSVGLKTSFGRWSLTGIFPLSPTLDTAGILTRTVADAAFAFVAIDAEEVSGASQSISRVDACDPTDFVIGTGDPALWEDCDPGIVDAVQIALNELGEKGVRITSSNLPEVHGAVHLLNTSVVGEAEFGEFLASELPAWQDTLDPLVAHIFANIQSVSAIDYLKQRRLICQLQRSAPARFETCDVVASPTVPITPPRLQDVAEVEGYRPSNLKALRNTYVGNALGLCSITLPVGLDAAGLPVGLQFLAPRHGEDKLLSIALCVERLLGNANERLGKPPAFSG